MSCPYSAEQQESLQELNKIPPVPQDPLPDQSQPLSTARETSSIPMVIHFIKIMAGRSISRKILDLSL